MRILKNSNFNSRSLLVAAAAVCVPSMAQAALTDGLISYNTMDASTLNDLDSNGIDSGDNLTNEVSGAQNLIVVTEAGSTVGFVTGKYGDALDNPNAAGHANQGYASYANNHDPGTGSLSVSTWFKLDANTNGLTVIAQKGAGSSAGEGWLLGTSGDEIWFRMYDGNTGNSFSFISNTDLISADTWHHVAFSYDGESTDGSTSATDNVKLYVDGSLTGTFGLNANSIGTPENFQLFTYIGDNLGMEGALDDFAVWDRALSESEIQTIAGSSVSLANIPEPSSLALLGLGGLMLAKRRRSNV